MIIYMRSGHMASGCVTVCDTNHLASCLWTVDNSGAINNLVLHDFPIAAHVEGSLSSMHSMHRMPTWMGDLGDGERWRRGQ